MTNSPEKYPAYPVVYLFLVFLPLMFLKYRGHISECLLAIRFTAIDSVIVTAAGNPSGMTATASATATMNASIKL